MKWVKASERTPVNSDHVFIKRGVNKFIGFFSEGNWYYDNTAMMSVHFHEIEWLDESPSLPEHGKGEEEKILSLIKEAHDHGFQISRSNLKWGRAKSWDEFSKQNNLRHPETKEAEKEVK